MNQHQPSPVELQQLVIQDGLMSPEDWAALGLEGKEAWLAGRDDAGVLAQASAFALLGRRPLRDILRTWRQFRILPDERANRLLAQVEAHDA